MNDSGNRPVILMTDFGHQDDYVGLMKGVLLNNCNNPTIIDLSHGIPPGNIEAAAFILLHDYRYFPENSIYINVIDPGVGTKRDILVAEIGGRTFIAPDNGVLFPLLEQNRIQSVWSYVGGNDKMASSTFHGRDVMAPLAAAIHSNTLEKSLLHKKENWIKLDRFYPESKKDEITGKVLYIDHYGNLITNIEILNRSMGKIFFSGLELEEIDTFDDGKNGQIHYLTGSKDTVEIVEKNGSAQVRTQANPGDKVIWKRIDR